MVTKTSPISQVFIENLKWNFLPNNLILPQCEMELERELMMLWENEAAVILHF